MRLRDDESIEGAIPLDMLRTHLVESKGIKRETLPVVRGIDCSRCASYGSAGQKF